MQVSGETRVCELCGPVVVVHKVHSSGGCVSYLPARRQRAQLLTIHITEIPAEREAQRDYYTFIIVILK